MTTTQASDTAVAAHRNNAPVIIRRLIQALLAPVAGIVFAVVLIQAYGYQGLPTLAVGLLSAVNTPQDAASTLAWGLPLLIATVGVLIPFRAGIWSLGADGQIYAGAFVAALVGAFLPIGVSPVHQALCLALAAITGALISAALGWLKAVWDVDILATLLSSFILVGLCVYLGTGPFNDPQSPAPAATPAIAETARFLLLVPKSQLTLAVVPVLIVLAVTWWFVERSVVGYQWRMVGSSPRFAAAVGINVVRSQIVAMAVSGALCGLAGSLLVTATQGRFSAEIAVGMGWIAILLALISRARVVSAVIWVLVYAVLQSASRRIEQIAEVPAEISLMVICLVLVIASCAPAITTLSAQAWSRLRRRKKEAAHGMD